MVFGSPKKNAANNIKKIEKGHGNKKIVDTLNKGLNENPELIEDIAIQLIGIIQTDKKDTFSYCLEVLLNIAEIEPDILANSVDAIIKIIQGSEEDGLDNDSILKALDILSILASGYPELMQPVVPVLLRKMKNPNSQIRSATYYILDIIAKSNPEFYSDHTLDLIRSLHGLNIDERVYAARLIGEIASYSPKVIDESYDVLSALANKHPDTQVRQEAHDVLAKFKVEEKTPELTIDEPEEDLLEFETDFIGIDEIKSEDEDFDRMADDLAQRIQGIDFESSAAEMLRSLGMDHLIVKTEFKETKSFKKKEILRPDAQEIENITPDETFVEEVIKPAVKEKDDDSSVLPLKKLPEKPNIKPKVFHEHALKRIEQMVTDPNIKPRLSPVKEITQKDLIEPPVPEITSETVPAPETKTDVLAPPELAVAAQTTIEPLPDNTIEMLHTIFTELSNEDWVRSVGLTTHDGTLITASEPEFMEQNILKKISGMITLEENMSPHKGFRNRISLELSDKLLVAMSIDEKYNIIFLTKPDVQFGMVLYELNKTADKIEQIIY
ncbi:MAG: hypothetical protein P1P80_09840 [ANME-2 cluster archaeon]|nr:hypothetical protein [ANME-2 cluster archaeon]